MNRLILSLLLLVSTVAAAEQTPRIISAGGSITEILFALEKQHLLVATDNTSTYPQAAAALPKLGYFRQLSVEGVLSYQPSLLIGAQGTGPESLASQLTAAGVKVVITNEQRDRQGLRHLISEIGQLVDATAQAEALNKALEQQVSNLINQANWQQDIRGLFVLSGGERGLTVAGGNTVPQALFDDARLHNIAAGMRDYKIIANESVLLANPDVIFVAGHNIRSEQDRLALCQHPAIKATNAGRHCRLIGMSSSYSLGLSPRYPQALKIMIDSAQQVQADGR